MVIDYGEESDTTYIVMEFVEAGTLSELLGKPMVPDQMSGLIDQVGSALQYAHEQGVVHRDIKPSNILLPKPDWPLLTDFGLAKITGGSQLTQSGTVAGTPAYMSPEQGRGEKVDSRSDLYSLGIVLYEMATGVVPYHAETPMAVVVKHIIDPLPLPRSKNPELPEPIERVILKSLSKDPADRFQDADEMVKALDAAIKGLPTAAAIPVPSVHIGQSTTIEGTGEVGAASQAPARQVANEINGSETAPAIKRGLLAGRGRLAAAVAGGLLLLTVVVFGATQLLNEPTTVPNTSGVLAGEQQPTPAENPLIVETEPDLELIPENAERFLEQARALADSGDPDGAADMIGAALQVASEESWAHEEAGYIMIDMQEYDPAAEEFRQALRLDPSTIWNYYNQADALVATGRQDEAAAVLLGAMQDPYLADDPDELDSIGWFFLALEMVNEAEDAFNRALEADPDNPTRYEGLAEAAYQRSGPQAGIERVEAGIQRFPEHAPFYESAGWWYWELGDLTQAAEAFNQSIELDPTNNSVYGTLANMLVEMGREEEAEVLMQRGLAQNADKPGFYIDTANFYMSNGRSDDAIPLFEQAIELDPEDGWSYAYLARALMDSGDGNRARQVLGDADAWNPGDPWLDEFIGWSYLNMGDCETAIEYFESALSIDPSIDTAEEGIQECGG